MLWDFYKTSRTSLVETSLQQLANGEGNFEQQGSPDQGTLQQLLKKIDPQTLQKILGQVSQQVDSREYSDHVTPGVGNTNPLGNLGAGGLATIAAVLLNHLKQAGAQPTQIPGVKQLIRTRWMPTMWRRLPNTRRRTILTCLAKRRLRSVKQKPDLLHSFIGKAGMALAAAALASHFIKMDRKAPK